MREGSSSASNYLKFSLHIFVLTLGFSSKADAQYSDMFKSYSFCALLYFRDIGEDEKNINKTFDEIEASVANKCGHHITALRSKLAQYGITRKGEQNKIIDNLYKDKVSMFKRHYESGQRTARNYADSVPFMDRWKLCFLEKAEYYGENSCEAPPFLKNTVLSSCSDQENLLRRALANDPKFNSLRFNQVDKLISYTRNYWSARIEQTIVDTRIEKNLCR